MEEEPAIYRPLVSTGQTVPQVGDGPLVVRISLLHNEAQVHQGKAVVWFNTQYLEWMHCLNDSLFHHPSQLKASLNHLSITWV